MNPLNSLRTAVISIAMVVLAAVAQAAPPTRVARLGHLQGDVSLLEAGDSDWIQALLNQPLTTGDRLWTDQGAGAELQLEGAAIRMGEQSNLNVLDLDERITLLQLSQGALRVRVRMLGPQQSIEVDTPNLALVLRRTGDYRIEVDPQSGATLVLVRSGLAEVFGDGTTYRVDNHQAYRFYGTRLSDYEGVSDYRSDELDRWAQERERRLDSSASARYVPMGVVGYEDLDANGRWVVDGNYGNVWLPSQVDAGWTPYRDGRWAWLDSWGWTWIDNAPWGYAVSHYGRWAYLGNAWGWVPGPKHERVVYEPALVVFVGGDHGRTPPHRRSGIGNTGWFPLGPREVYKPEQAPTRQGYANQHVPGAVVVANQMPSASAPELNVHGRPPRDNHPVPARNVPPAPDVATIFVPALPTRPAEPKGRVRVITPADDPVLRPVSVPSPEGSFGSSRVERPREIATPVTRPLGLVVTPARNEPPAVETTRIDAQRRDTIRNEAANFERHKNDTTRNNISGPAAASLDATNPEAVRNANAQADNVRAEAARAEVAKRIAAKIEEAKGNAAQVEAAKNLAAQAAAFQARGFQEQAARAAETNRQNAASANAARAEAAKAELAKTEAANAHPEQGKQRGRDSDARRANGQLPDKEWKPEEDLLQRGKRKQ